MRRFFCLFGILLFVSGFSFADTNFLVNFNDLIDDGDGQNAGTTFGYSEQADISTSEEDKQAMKTSLFIENWLVKYNSSATTTLSKRLTKIIPVVSNELEKTVMGVRIVFPEGPYDADATICPPFLIPVNSGDGTSENDDNSGQKFDKKGVLRNVGSIKKVAMTVRGLDYPHSVSLIVEDSGAKGNTKVREIPLGNLDFQGWKTLVWTNPNYVYSVRNLALKRIPSYPFNVSTLRLLGIKFSRKSASMGGDFISYISDISVTYDKAIDDTLPVDIDDEAAWGILTAREKTNYRMEMENFGRRQVLEYGKKKLQDQSRPNTFPADGEIVSPTRKNEKSSNEIEVNVNDDTADR